MNYYGKSVVEKKMIEQRRLNEANHLMSSIPLLFLVLALLISFQVTTAAVSFASTLTPLYEVTEVMMDAQGVNAAIVGLMFGSDSNSVLSFTSQVSGAARTFSYSVNPGSTYLGSNITLTTSGIFDIATNLFEMSTSGSLAGVSWFGTGVGSIVGDPLGDYSWSFNLPIIGVVAWMSHVTYTGSNDQNSVATWSLTVGDQMFGGEARDRILTPLPIAGEPPGPPTWVWLSPHFERPGIQPFQIRSGGFVPAPDGGTGSFETHIETVPEPSSLIVWATAAVGLLAWSWWRINGHSIEKQRRNRKLKNWDRFIFATTRRRDSLPCLI